MDLWAVRRINSKSGLSPVLPGLLDLSPNWLLSPTFTLFVGIGKKPKSLGMVLKVLCVIIPLDLTYWFHSPSPDPPSLAFMFQIEVHHPLLNLTRTWIFFYFMHLTNKLGRFSREFTLSCWCLYTPGAY